MSYVLHTIENYDRRANRDMDVLLQQEGISRDCNLDYSCGIFDDDELIATGSCFGNTLRCFAVRSDHRGEGLLGQLVSHLVQEELQRGFLDLYVYTKCESAPLFRDLGFYTVAELPGKVAFLENRRGGFERYCQSLEQAQGETQAAIVMNANPFTNGHRHLVETAAAENDIVHLFVLSENRSIFPTSVRRELVRLGTADLSNVILHDTGDYLISSATFPSYFFRETEDVIAGHAALDAAVFLKIANMLGIRRRYVGTEPSSLVTGIYNRVLAEQLPQRGISCIEIPRLCCGDAPVSAGRVRQLLHDGKTEEVRPLVPDSTWRFLDSPASEPILKAIRGQTNVTHY